MSLYLAGSAANDCGASLTATQEVRINVLPVMPEADNAIVCSVQWATLKVKSTDASMYYRRYDVPVAGDPLTTGITYKTLTLTASTTYDVEAVNTSGCASPRKTVTVTVTPIPVTPVVEDKAICVGEQVTLSVQSSSPAYTYRWYESDGCYIKTGVNYTTLILTADRIYFVEAINWLGCVSPRKAVTVTVTPIPIILSVEGNVLTALAGNYSYQWLLNGQEIADADSQSYIANQSGSYAVRVTDTQMGCTSTSRAEQITITAIPTALDQSIRIYPNPTKSILTIELPAYTYTSAILYNTTGQAVKQAGTTAKQLQLQVDHLPRGLYFLLLQTSQGLVQHRVVLE